MQIDGARRKVLVIGLSGLVGPPIVKYLCDHYLSCTTVVGATRNVDSPSARRLLSSVTGSGLELIRADMSDEKSICEALQGVSFSDVRRWPWCDDVAYQVSTVMIVTPGAENRVDLVNNVIRACHEAAAVSHVVVLSTLAAARESTVLGGQYMKIEEAVSSCGINYTILRLSLFMENMLAHVRTAQRDQQIRSSLTPSSTFAVTAAADIARAAAVVLADPSAHSSKTYSLTGAIVSMEMVAEAYSKASGTEIVYLQVQYFCLANFNK